MKMKALFTLLILSVIMKLNAQIVEEHSYTLNKNLWSFDRVYLDQSGYKYYFHDKTNRTITLYNLDHSIFKTITYPVYPANTNWTPYLLYISEKLFDTDEDIDFLLNYFDDSNYLNSWIRIIKENGSILAEYSHCTLNVDFEWSDAIFNVGDHANMMLISLTDSAEKIYSLPGKLPCNSCSGSTSNIQSQKIKSLGLKSFPNPATEKFTIEYSLPEQAQNATITIYNSQGKTINVFNIDNKFNSLELNTSEFKNGIYFYDLQADNKVLASKKLIVIK